MRIYTTTTNPTAPIVRDIEGACCDVVQCTKFSSDVGPNITGEGLWWENGGYSKEEVKGCFYVSEESNHLGAGESDWDNAMILMDSSRSSPIYGRSVTVQPPSVKLLPCIKI